MLVYLFLVLGSIDACCSSVLAGVLLVCLLSIAVYIEVSKVDVVSLKISNARTNCAAHHRHVQ